MSEEGYKDTVHYEARARLSLRTWKENVIGTGEIAKAVTDAVEFNGNNLLGNPQRFGPKNQPLYKLHLSLDDPSKLVEFERRLYDLFLGDNDQRAFTNLVTLFGQRYPINAYLFFLKDRSKYMPIAPNKFDDAFKKLGVNFTTSGKCSWDNYKTYNSLLARIQLLLMEKLDGEVRLLDAHSFAYILAVQMSQANDHLQTIIDQQLADYYELPPKERDSVIKARIGQGIFREKVVANFERCAVTNCANLELLTASHMRPWKDCDAHQAVDGFNGLLLSPNLDALFDKGFITFSDEGKIVISPVLLPSDSKALGIDSSMKIHKALDPKHLHYLKYHRDHIFRAG
jgi:predicted restriction endonuclease